MTKLTRDEELKTLALLETLAEVEYAPESHAMLGLGYAYASDFETYLGKLLARRLVKRGRLQHTIELDDNGRDVLNKIAEMRETK